MRDYLEYLGKNPLKVVWIGFITLFVVVGEYYLISDFSVIVGDNNVFVAIAGIVFLLAVFCLAMYQPYKEYKDGL